ncbi:MAG: lipocalin family protein, partial [bacterium]
MVKKPVAIAAALSWAALVWCAIEGGARAQDFRTRQEVELSRFAGDWYELARTPNEYEDARKTKGGENYSACFNVRTEYT